MKRALVISGGGSKGAFAVGVLKELHQMYPGLQFDIYVGTSTGSLVVSLSSLNLLDKLENVYTHVENKDIFIEGNIVNKISDNSIFDVEPLWKLIQENYTDEDYENLKLSGKKVFLNTVCLQTNQLNVFTNDASSINPGDYKVIQTVNANHFRRAMLASACQPVFMQPIRINRGVPGAADPDLQYVDGGVLEYIGLQIAIDAGADEIFAIFLSPGSSTPRAGFKDYKNLMDILTTTIDILTSDVGKNDVLITDQFNAALQYIAGVKNQMLLDGVPQVTIDKYFTLPDDNIFQNAKPYRIFKIYPSTSLGGGPGGLTFDPDEMTAMLQRGQNAFITFASSLKPGDITWA